MTPNDEKPPAALKKEESADQSAASIEISSELLTALQMPFKLTESQSRAYTVLLVLGQLTADEISNYSGIPMTKIKSTIKTLEEKQLIKPLPGVVTRYRAFAPYKELADEVQSFTKDTEKSWKELQKLQTQTLSEIHDELQTMTRQTRSALENLNERQGIALNEAAMATNIVLSNVAENLQKSLDNLTTESVNEISEHTTSIQQALSTLIDKGSTQLDADQQLALDDASKAMSAHQEETNQWISSTLEQLLDQTSGSTQQITTWLDDAKALFDRNIDFSMKSVASEVTSQKVETTDIIEDTANTVTDEITTHTQETQGVLAALQKETKQILTKHHQELSSQIQDMWAQQTQALDNAIMDLEKTVQKENQQLIQERDTAAATMNTKIKSGCEDSIKSIETLFQDLEKTQQHASSELRQLHKEAETTIAQWPPSSLNFSQFSKIKTTTSKLIEQVKTEQNQLLDSTSQDLATEMQDTYVARLLEVQNLLQALIEEGKSQKTKLTENFKSIADQVGRRLKRRLAIIQKTAQTFLSNFQSNVDSLEAQYQALGKQMQKLLKNEANATLKALEETEVQIKERTDTRLLQAQDTINQSAQENLAKATKEQEGSLKQVKTFQAAMKNTIKETTKELQQEFTKLEGIVRQYSDGIESTADKFRAEQILKIETAIEKYQPAFTRLQSTRDNAITLAMNSLAAQLTKRHQNTLNDFNTLMLENIPVYGLSALDSYQTTFQKNATALETEALSATESAILKQLTASELETIDTGITKAFSKQIDDVSASLQDFLAGQQTLQDSQSETALNLAQDELIEVFEQQISKHNEMLAKSFISKLKPVLSKCKTKISKQISREEQISKIIQTTHKKIKTSLAPIVARRSKAIRDKLDEELESTFQTLISQLEKQTNQEAKVTEIIDSTATNLEKLSETQFKKEPKENLNEQVSNLLAIFTEYQSAIERQHMTNTKNITTKFQDLFKEMIETSYVGSLKSQINSLLQKTCIEVLRLYRTKIAAEQTTVIEKAEAAYQTALDKQLRTQMQPRIHEYSTSESPTINTVIDETKTVLAETTKNADANSRTLIEKYWLPLTKIIEEYSSVVVGNLTALNTATGSAVDQTTMNVNTTLTNFEDDSNKLLSATVQTFDREKSAINEQITQSFTELQEDCIAQLQEAQTLLETLNTDIVARKATTTEKIESMAGEIDATTTSHYATTRKITNAFVENVQTELATQEERVENLKKNIQDLIHKQGVVLNEGVDRILTQLVEFSETQIPKMQGIIEESGQNYVNRIEEQRANTDHHFEEFALTLSKELDKYTSTLQQELEQLQTITSKLVEQIGKATDTIDTEITKETDTSKVNLLNTINAQQQVLNQDISSTFQSLAKKTQQIQVQLLDKLNRVRDEGREALDQDQTEITTALDTTLNTTVNKKEQAIQAQLETQKAKNQALITQLGETLSAIRDSVTTTSDSLQESVTSALMNVQAELIKIHSNSRTLIEETDQTLRTEIGEEAEKTLQSQTKSIGLTDSRLKRAIQDSIRRTKESLQSLKGTASTDLQQKNKSFVASITQTLENVKDGLMTQTQQTGRRISRTLSKERQTLKLEYQTLEKEITTRAKTAETTAVNSLQLFSTQTEPTLDRLRTQASQTEEILIGLWDTLTKLEPAEAERTWRIVTCEGIQNHLLDMLRRIDETITLVYPSFDEVPVTELSKIQPQSRVHIITTLDREKQLASAQKLLQQGNIRIWDNPNMEFYGGSRDGEEVLIAPTYGNQGEIVAVVSDQASYIALFNQTLGPRWVSASEEIRLRS
ncbi:MAG: helix-turn-helix domain-containing protein [Promethearchaeota archaeon]